MKLSFSPRDHDQEAVNDVQVEQRGAKVAQVPAARFVWRGAIIIIVLAAIWHLWNSSRIYARGIVSSNYLEHFAPARSRIAGIYVQPGDVVETGDILFVLVSDDAKNDMQKVGSVIQQRELELANLQKTRDTLSVDTKGATSRYSQLEQQKQQILLDIPRLNHEHETRTRSLLRNIRLKQLSLRKWEDKYQRESTRHEQVELLKRLDAATAADSQKQEELLTQAEDNREALRLELNELEAQLVSSRTQHQLRIDTLEKQLNTVDLTIGELLQEHRRQLDERVRNINLDIERIITQIASLREDYQYQKRLAGPTEFNAQDNGVVIEVDASDGSVVTENAFIMSVASTGEIWVDAYIETDQRDLLKDYKEVYLVDDSGQRVEGTITAGGELEVNVPQLLRNIDADMKRALHVHIGIPGDRGDLLPGNIVDVVIR